MIEFYNSVTTFCMPIDIYYQGSTTRGCYSEALNPNGRNVSEILGEG